MSNILLFVMIASLTIASPGPGVLLTLRNTLAYRIVHALWGIIGVVVGMAGIGLIASSSLGVILITSPYALTVVKAVGAAYLLYLGTKLFRSKPKGLQEGETETTRPSGYALFREAFVITLFNPKPVVFFMALFPQFIDATHPVPLQFAVLISVFCLLVFLIHCLYASCASLVRSKFIGDDFFVVINRVAGCIFMFFGTMLGVSIFL